MLTNLLANLSQSFPIRATLSCSRNVTRPLNRPLKSTAWDVLTARALYGALGSVHRR